MKHLKMFFTCVVLLMMSTALYAQSRITGVVKDETGEPIIGASVLEKGTTNGTITDFDGNFSLTASSKGTLVVSYIGFQTQEVAVAGKKILSVTMKEDSKTLQEVVVVGYGTI